MTALEVDRQTDELDAAAVALVARSRRAQGLPARISDPAVIAQVATLVGTRREAPHLAHAGAGR
jgi:hypothetical protein